MREYDSFEDACNDPELGLMIVWKCDLCGAEREDYPGCNEGGECQCGGWWQQSGERYNG